MPEPSFVSHAARALYGFEPLAVESLDQYQFDWRGIYRVRDARHGWWVMRLSRDPEMAEALGNTARLLSWLTQAAYPAPSVRPTNDQQLVGRVGEWAISLLAYIEGDMLDPTATEQLEAAAQVLCRLHTVRAGPQQFAPSRCHPDHIAIAAQQLASNRANLPAAFQPLAADLHAAMLALQRHQPGRLCIAHGDCWYRNAIAAPGGGVTLIDWDQAGIGLGLLDLGNLLLTTHFDLDRPLVLRADRAKIKAIMQGYQRHCSLAQGDKKLIAHATRFLLAFQLGSYLADGALAQHADFPFVLRKLQARYAATQDIAEIAAEYIG